MIDRATEIDPAAKQTAHQIFRAVAVAEAKVHGTTLEKVHFHEVGAIDSIADIVGTAVALHSLGIQQIIASPVPTGTGSITIAHGRVSVPAPATAELLCGIPIAPSNIEAELTTPTGSCDLKGVRPTVWSGSSNDDRKRWLWRGNERPGWPSQCVASVTGPNDRIARESGIRSSRCFGNQH